MTTWDNFSIFESGVVQLLRYVMLCGTYRGVACVCVLHTYCIFGDVIDGAAGYVKLALLSIKFEILKNDCATATRPQHPKSLTGCFGCE